jgi:hypothetical protein
MEMSDQLYAAAALPYRNSAQYVVAKIKKSTPLLA